MRLSYRLVSGVLFLACIGGMGFALILEHMQGLEPCPLCIFQRVGLIGLGVFSLLGFLHNPSHHIIKRIYSILASISIVWSAGVAARHVWLQHLPPEKVPSCGPGLNYLLDALPMKTVLDQVLSGSGECAEVDWLLLGLSLPTWSFLFFAGLSVVCLWQVFRSYK